MTDQPVYTIRIAAPLVGVPQQTLRLYSQNDIERLLLIRRLIDELGVNLAGADIILRLRQQIDELKHENRQLKRELQRVRDQQLPAVQPDGPRMERRR